MSDWEGENPFQNAREVGRENGPPRPLPNPLFSLSRTKVPNLAFWEMAKKIRSL